jgi:hypothetical protein
MTTLTFPEAMREWQAQVTWHLEANTAAFVSPLSRSVQTLELPGARWVCDMTFPKMRADMWRTYTAWLAKMRGQAGRVYFGPPHYRGSNAPTWVPDPDAITCDSTEVTCDSTISVNQSNEIPWGEPITIYGGGQAGAVINTSGWVNNVTVLAAGDFLSYDTSRGRTLHMVVEDAASDSAGRAAITIEPPIRTAPAHGAAVEFVRPTCIMALQDGMTGAPSFSPYLKASVSLQLVEVF